MGNQYMSTYMKYMKTWSISSAITEMQIQSTGKCHLIPVRMATIKKTKITNVGEDIEKN